MEDVRLLSRRLVDVVIEGERKDLLAHGGVIAGRCRRGGGRSAMAGLMAPLGDSAISAERRARLGHLVVALGEALARSLEAPAAEHGGDVSDVSDVSDVGDVGDVGDVVADTVALLIKLHS